MTQSQTRVVHDPAQLPIQVRAFNGIKAISHKLSRIIELLEIIVRAMNENQPMRAATFEMHEFHGFNWDSFGAEITLRDQFGPARVRFKGETYTRRTNDKFGSEIWYSRAVGKKEDGTTEYEKLISFKDFDPPEPIGRKAHSALERTKPRNG